MSAVSVLVPATVANLGPGFDVLGACLAGLHDRVIVELHDGPAQVLGISGRDAELVPADPENNAIVVAARAMLKKLGDPRQPRLTIERSIPISAGLGSSAAASVAGALGAAAASGQDYSKYDVALAALEGEAGVAGRHLDNIAPCIFGGVTIVRSINPPEIHKILPKNEFWLTVATPQVRLETKAARGMLPKQVENSIWIQQMANTASLVYGLIHGDAIAVANALQDGFAEPVRKFTVPNYDAMKAASLAAGALGFNISGAGPSVFALSVNKVSAEAIAQGMLKSAGGKVTTVVGQIAAEGARCEG